MNSRRTLARLGVLGTLGLASTAAVLGIASPASAHVSVSPDVTSAGSYAVLTFSVPHGCDGSATTGITIKIPEGVNAVTPTRNDYYRVSKQLATLSPPVTDAHGNELTERVDTVRYRATTPLPDGYRDTFELSLQIPEDAAGETLVFPTVQTCEKGTTAWTQVPADGQSEDDLESPAPAFEVTDVADDAHGGDEASAETASDTSASSGDDDSAAAAEDGGSSNGLAVTGLVVGILGLATGATALARGRRQA